MFPLLAAARFAHYAAIAILFGLAAFPFYAQGRAAPLARFDRTIKWAAVLALVTAWLELFLMSANMGGALASAFDPQVLSAVVGDTAFGRVWVARILLAVGVLALRVKAGPARDRRLLILSGLLLASVALTGHSAMPGGVLGMLHRIADALHLLAAGWWIGGLLGLMLAVKGLGADAHRVLERFSGVGYGAVAVLVLSGVFKSAVLIAPLTAWVSTAYGQTLLVKLALFAGMGALALSNRLWITPGLKRGGDPALWLGRLRTQVAVELALGIGVLAVVGALGALSPPVAQ